MVVIFFAWHGCPPNSSKRVDAFHKIWWCHILKVATFFFIFFLQKINWCVVEVQSGSLILILVALRRFNLHSMKAVVWRSFTNLSVNEVLASSYLHDHSEGSSSMRFLAATSVHKPCHEYSIKWLWVVGLTWLFLPLSFAKMLNIKNQHLSPRLSQYRWGIWWQ